MQKIILYSFIAIVLFTAFFYFYDAAIFEADITENELVYSMDISLRAFLDHSRLPQPAIVHQVSAVGPSWKGLFLLIICLVGVPIMLGYRVATNSDKKK